MFLDLLEALDLFSWYETEVISGHAPVLKPFSLKWRKVSQTKLTNDNYSMLLTVIDMVFTTPEFG